MVKASSNGTKTAGGRSGSGVRRYVSKEREFNVKATVVIPCFGMPEKEVAKTLAALAGMINLKFGPRAQVLVAGKPVEFAEEDM